MAYNRIIWTPARLPPYRWVGTGTLPAVAVSGTSACLGAWSGNACLGRCPGALVPARQAASQHSLPPCLAAQVGAGWVPCPTCLGALPYDQIQTCRASMPLGYLECQVPRLLSICVGTAFRRSYLRDAQQPCLGCLSGLYQRARTPAQVCLQRLPAFRQQRLVLPQLCPWIAWTFQT